ncbi:MAG TPA: hydroxysqualene dehydroxylase HpnE [Blastocatellia bacterium]|nr:hydroxysqualene dehydroxylase HpnE [Blastocatellia bacterium]
MGAPRRGDGAMGRRGEAAAMNDNTHNSHPRAAASPHSPIVIIGGGFAGLAAAVDLAEQGKRVLLLERRNFLGGRAYSFTDKVTGDTIDNGQHLLMGCYHHTLNFLQKIGASHKVKFQPNPRVDFLSDTEGHTRFACPSLPAPLHLLAGLSRLKTIGWRDRWNVLRVGLALKTMNGKRARLADITVREWLNELGQSERMQRRFWDLMALATLNEAPERASADMFARVLEQGFMHTRQDSTMVIARVGLSDLYTTDAVQFIAARGGEVRLNAAVKAIEFANDRAAGVTLANGEYIAAAAIISAVPYFMLKDMLAPELLAAHFPAVTAFQSAPIVSINLWYDEAVTDLEFVSLLDSPIEWVFNKNAIAGDTQARRQHLALVISSAHQAAPQPKEALIEMASTEMKRFFPNARRQQPVHAYVIKEQHATISHTVGIARQRPTQKTPLANFYLAGDWTDTGLPATIESAVFSGQECARLLA